MEERRGAVGDVQHGAAILVTTSAWQPSATEAFLDTLFAIGVLLIFALWFCRAGCGSCTGTTRLPTGGTRIFRGCWETSVCRPICSRGQLGPAPLRADRPSLPRQREPRCRLPWRRRRRPRPCRPLRRRGRPHRRLRPSRDGGSRARSFTTWSLPSRWHSLCCLSGAPGAVGVTSRALAPHRGRRASPSMEPSIISRAIR